ncbi:MAG TPA: phenylalanine--tRNA ligase subunit beta, partial [Candidatus Pacearchaeota archaeon]|nr:phenylalanine--tRNA ligase subunit beta [Candidatus Pacearchaeota archaeon]
WLQSFFKEKLPKPEKLAEFLTMHSFEVEEVKEEDRDFILNIDILPNRACDCLSHLGIAREIAVLIKNSKFQIPNFKPKEDKTLKAKNFLTVEVKDQSACKRYTARVITDVKIASSPEVIQKRLKACGLRPINNVVDILNYVMLETGQPLHAFDYDKIEGKKLIVRFATERERIVTLDEKNYTLDKDILVIADEKQPLALAGIKGGKIPEIDEKTKTIVIESANFDQKIIRHSSRKLKLRTDASWRFENGIDPNLTEEVINEAAFLVQKYAKGKIVKGIVDFYPQRAYPRRIKLDLDYVEKLLGVKISPKEITKILNSLGFKIIKNASKINKSLLVEVPTRRLDISIPEDLIEEIGRIYGYQNIPPAMPILPISIPAKNEELLWEKKVKELIKEFGFTETYLYSFLSEKDAELFMLTPTRFISNLIEIKNPVSSNTKYLRPSLLPNLLKMVEANQKREKEIRVFELGKIYYLEDKNKLTEKKMIAGIISGSNKFLELKGVLESLFESLGIVDVFFDNFEDTPEETPRLFWQRGTSAEIKIGDLELGFLGEIRREILDFYKIEKPVFAFEIEFEKLLKVAEEEHEYEVPSSYPEIIRDIALLVPTQTLSGEVMQKIHELDKNNLIRDIDIFDIFEGEPLPKDKKNLAFHIIFQSKNRPLSSKEVDKVMEKIIKGLEKNKNWEVRK